MKLAEKLIYLRKEKGLSQLKLAEMMYVSRQAISRWETGAAVPTAENLKCLSNLYDVSLDYLFDDSEDEPERNNGFTDKLEENPSAVLHSVDDGKGRKWKLTKWALVALSLLILIVTVYIFAVVGKEESFVSINDLSKKEVELGAESESGFEVECLQRR